MTLKATHLTRWADQPNASLAEDPALQDPPGLINLMKQGYSLSTDSATVKATIMRCREIALGEKAQEKAQELIDGVVIEVMVYRRMHA